MQPGRAAKWIDGSIVGLSLLAPALGGATSLWAQSILVLGVGVLLILAPPRSLPSRLLTIVLAATIGFSTIQFLPARWFPAISLRETLESAHQLKLATTVSMQPWQSLERFILFGATISWAVFLVCHRWSMRRRALVAMYASAATALALSSIVFYLAGWSPPFWNPENGPFGFFPNRSQTGLVLISSGVLCLALALRNAVRKRKSAFGWTAAFLVNAGALVLNQDRWCIVLFFGGSISWLVWNTWVKSTQRSWTIALSGLLFLPLVFVLEPHLWKTTRLPPGRFISESHFNIQKDAIRLLKRASWQGIGQGNFEPVFAQYRSVSRAQDRVRHPESDWLWSAIELGWIVPLLIAGAVSAFVGRNWPSASTPNFRLCSALTICGVVFLIDTLFNVPAHRVGAVWPFLLLISLIRDLKAGFGVTRKPRGFYRVAGGAWVCAAVLWLGSAIGFQTPIPTSASAATIREELGQSLKKNDYALAVAQATAGLQWAPLDWQFYFRRAVAELFASGATFSTLLDFGRARLLEPNLIQVPLDEARAWLSRDSRFVFSAFVEVLRRAGPKKADYFRTILKLGEHDPFVRGELFSLTYKDPELLVIFLAFATPDEFTDELKRLLLEDPNLRTLNNPERVQLFSLWISKGDSKAFKEMMAQHPDWLETGWAPLAECLAKDGDFQEACEVVQRYVSSPLLPSITHSASLAELRQNLVINRADFASGFALVQAFTKANDFERALETISSLTAHPSCPPYFHYVEARLLGAAKRYEAAWKSWQTYFRAADTASRGK